MPKLIFCDIDNTLWDWDRNIPPSTVEAIYRLHEKGHLAFICTGRSMGNVRAKELLDLPFAGIVAACGNHIILNDKLLYEYIMPDELLAKCIAVCKKYHSPIVVEGPEDHWVDEEGFDGDPYVDYLYQSMGDACHPLSQYRPGMRANKLSVVINPDTDYEKMQQELDGEITFIKHPGPIVEMIPYGTSKAWGIRWLLEYLEVPVEDTYAIGDSSNDLDMLRFVGHSICMGNGTDAAKEAAEFVTDDIHEDGFYKAMAHYDLL